MSVETKRKTRILLADGHYIVRQGTRRIFETETDFEIVGEADNGEQVVRLARELKPDVIVMEAQLGKLDSVEATRRVKAHQSDAAVLVLTAHNDEHYIAELLRAGAAGCLLKSVHGEQLIQSIRSISRGMLVLDPALEQRILKHVGTLRRVALSPVEHLTRREFDVLKLVADGKTNRAIAIELGVGPRTVKQHLANIYTKMHVSSRTEAVSKAIRHGLLASED